MTTFNSFNGDSTDAKANAGYTLDFHHVASGKEVSFKAFITSLSDQYQSNWDKEEIYGRMDPIQTFKSTQRTISVSWDIVAGSISEAKRNMKELSLLFNMLYPSYSSKSAGSTTGMIAAPLLRMRFANLISKEGKIGSVSEAGLLGSVDGFNFEPAMDDAMFGDSQGNLYPKIINLSCTFSVIHEHELGWFGEEQRRESFPYGKIDSSSSVTPNSTTSETGVPEENSSSEKVKEAAAAQVLGSV